MRMLIAAGGTGGHVYPALAVARSLAERTAEAEFLWLGGRRGLEATIVPGAGFELRRLWLRSLRTVDLSTHTLLDPLRLAASYPQALALMARWRPRVVFTTGGYAAIPVLAAAASLRVPSVLWEGNLLPGRSVRATARLASVLTVSFAETCARLPGRCYVTGTPIRSFRGADRAAARTRLQLPPADPCLLVFGGSQAVRRLNAAVSQALPELLPRTAVLHVTGHGAYAEALRRREALPAELRGRYRPFAFLGDEMTDALVAADLLVGRAGSSTLAEAAAVGLPMVVVPYPHASAHQAANARHLEKAGAARIVPDERFDAASLVEAAALLEDGAQLEAMREAARSFGRPGAAAAVAELVLALAERSPLPSTELVERTSRATA
ncbi:MAG TPA: UDP-N-acetylglucosamine--N-acetylmuramyl-(pentapeptide) pyrophosphoryl-undecaprenol N-acetylglucosamine transferase [Candidatus Limnocylindria bacterium]|nr:UDP-N-acetylglucosamine--N-acetylmuramyl-(pentapeptide) pyrophosphoryl-undecaprenol N-acetylglucosamine transferase [Candidatus Limnocylindria bacterium]